MVAFKTIKVFVEEPFAYITLNRPQAKNAMNQQMVLELLEVFSRMEPDRAIRGIVLTGAEGTFCAGDDVKEMQAVYADPTTKDDTRTEEFETLLQAINHAPQVVVARVEGEALGGGLGLVCASDIAIAATDSVFALPEVRLGIVPAMIAPYVIQRVGVTTARRLMLTGARFDGLEAVKYNLVHDACEPADLDWRVEAALADIRECSPQALAICKRLLFEIADTNFDANPIYRANILDELRRSEEGQEGMLAFIQKRKPEWAKT